MDDDDIHHVDFTTASTLEVFIARIKEVFLDWELNKVSNEQAVWKTDYNHSVWTRKSESVVLVDPESHWNNDVKLTLTHYALKIEENPCVKENNLTQVQHDLLSFDNDFCHISLPDRHHLTRWYGLRNFIVLTPENMEDVDSESKVKTLLSCLHIAVEDIEIGIPVFLRSGHPDQFYHSGLCRLQKYQIDFEMVHLHHYPSHCKYLPGLLAMFKAKIGACLLVEPVTVAVQFSYKKTWPAVENCEELLVSVDELPFGSLLTAIKDVTVRAVWPRLLEQSVVDGESYSDLEPLLAPVWRASCTTVDEPLCLLTAFFNEFIDFANILLLNSLSSRPFMEGKPQETIPIETLMLYLYYLFPDANSNQGTVLYYPDHLSPNAVKKERVEDPAEKIYEEKLKDLKSAPYGSLPWRLAIIMSYLVHTNRDGDYKSADFLWHEFTREIAFRVEHNIPIPGVEPGYPNPNRCLLYQKLQIINFCIALRLEHEKSALRGSDEPDSDPDEFFDCSVNDDEANVKIAPWDQPAGRLSKQDELRLLNTDKPLYELEKALDFFKNKTIYSYATHLLPVFTSCLLLKLEILANEVALSEYRTALDRLIKRAKETTWNGKIDVFYYMNLKMDVDKVVKLAVRFKAIYDKFLSSGLEFDETVLKKFVGDLVMGQDVLVPNGGVLSSYGKVLQQILIASDPKDDLASDVPVDFPKPFEKEMIFRVMTNKGPQRMYATLSKDEFRLCGAFANFDMA